ncbi:MAG TPA: hypothetical protein VFO19_17805, partial [Vicinamibacterales bacterium]|nr:hypothetical protein [Vicinamibacterales bacterium]
VLSVTFLAAGLRALSLYLFRRTASGSIAVVIPLLILLNPNVLYLQSTPMTEPMMFGLALLALAATDRWIETPSPRGRRVAGILISLLMLTRYEGWLIAGGLVGVAAMAHRRRGMRVALALVPWVVATVLAFLVFSKASTNVWFVAGGFFTADNPARQDGAKVYAQIRETTDALGGPALIWAAVVGAVACLVRAPRSPACLLPVSLVLAGALPFLAFYDGHPLRVRYMAPLVVAAGALAGYALWVVPARGRTLGAAALVAIAIWQRPPLSPDAPVVLEAQWETPFRDGRRAVTAALARDWDGTPILASMGSLGHYMQETSAAGFDLKDFLHEGSFDLWLAATAMPRRHVRWILIEEQAEGGDVLAQRARSASAFLDGFTRVAEGGGVALYRRD